MEPIVLSSMILLAYCIYILLENEHCRCWKVLNNRLAKLTLKKALTDLPIAANTHEFECGRFNNARSIIRAPPLRPMVSLRVQQKER